MSYSIQDNKNLKKEADLLYDLFLKTTTDYLINNPSKDIPERYSIIFTIKEKVEAELSILRYMLIRCVAAQLYIAKDNGADVNKFKELIKEIINPFADQAFDYFDSIKELM